jgi:hypothetical protein
MGWTDRIKAALGMGGRKPEADVSYDPAPNGRSSGRTPRAARADEGTSAGEVPDMQLSGLPASDPEGGDEATGPAREPGGP